MMTTMTDEWWSMTDDDYNDYDYDYDDDDNDDDDFDDDYDDDYDDDDDVTPSSNTRSYTLRRLPLSPRSFEHLPGRGQLSGGMSEYM